MLPSCDERLTPSGHSWYHNDKTFTKVIRFLQILNLTVKKAILTENFWYNKQQVMQQMTCELYVTQDT